MLTVRLSNETEEKLREFCQQQQKTKSQVVKEALVAYLQKAEAAHSPYDLGKDLFGQEGSSRTDGSIKFKSRLKEKLHEKYSR
ncbi:MAG: CopG family transcriptional regulator [Bacteroidota bacterium]